MSGDKRLSEYRDAMAQVITIMDGKLDDEDMSLFKINAQKAIDISEEWYNLVANKDSEINGTNKRREYMSCAELIAEVERVEAGKETDKDSQIRRLTLEARFYKRSADRYSEIIANQKPELKNGELGNLRQIADVIMDEMRKEISRNGYSDLTLAMEGSAKGLYEIIELNGIKD